MPADGPACGLDLDKALATFAQITAAVQDLTKAFNEGQAQIGLAADATSQQMIAAQQKVTEAAQRETSQRQKLIESESQGKIDALNSQLADELLANQKKVADAQDAAKKTVTAARDGNAQISADTAQKNDKEVEGEANKNAKIVDANAKKTADLETLNAQSSAKIHQAQLDLVNEEIAGLQQGTAEYAKAAKEKLAITQKLLADMKTATDKADAAQKKSDADKTAETKKAQDAYQSGWMKALAPVESAFSSVVTSMMKGNVTFQKAASQAAQQFLQSEIKADAEWLAHKLLVNALGLQSDKTTAQGGLFAHLFMETGKTGATTTNVAARTGVENASQTSWLGKLGELIAGWLGIETGKTVATTTGNAARATSDAAAAAAGEAAAVMTGFSQISIDAAVAAAGTMASISAIPYIGPFLAPEMAAEAYGVTLGFAAGMGAEGGFDIPSGVNPVTQLHQEEMVLPATIANPLRAALKTSSGLASGLAAGGGTVSGGGSGGGISHSGDINLSIMAPPSAMTGMSPNEAQRWVAQQIQGGVRQAYLRMAPA